MPAERKGPGPRDRGLETGVRHGKGVSHKPEFSAYVQMFFFAVNAHIQ